MHLRWCIPAGLCCAMSPCVAGAAFINSLESFGGTTKDPVTWAEFAEPGMTITQDDVLTFSSPGQTLHGGFFTTRTLKVGIGGKVSADVRVDNIDYVVAPFLCLSDNPNAMTAPADGAPNSLVLSFDSDLPGFNAKRGSGSTATGFTFNGSYAPAVGTWYTFQIERLSATSARFSAFLTSTGDPLGSTTLSLTGMPSNLFVSVGGYGGGALSIDNVTIPEPASLALLTLALAGAMRRRRRAG